MAFGWVKIDRNQRQANMLLCVDLDELRGICLIDARRERTLLAADIMRGHDSAVDRNRQCLGSVIVYAAHLRAYTSHHVLIADGRLWHVLIGLVFHFGFFPVG